MTHLATNKRATLADFDALGAEKGWLATTGDDDSANTQTTPSNNVSTGTPTRHAAAMRLVKQHLPRHVVYNIVQ